MLDTEFGSRLLDARVTFREWRNGNEVYERRVDPDAEWHHVSERVAAARSFAMASHRCDGLNRSRYAAERGRGLREIVRNDGIAALLGARLQRYDSRMQTMDKRAFSVATLRDEGDDRAYWQARTATERLEAVEQMRRIIYGYDPATRLQRLLAVAERERR